MKNLLLLFIVIPFTIFSQSKEYWGMTEKGGKDNLGCIFVMDEYGENQQIVHDFEYKQAGAGFDLSKMLLGSDGLMYGATEYGGYSNTGVIFSYNTSTRVYTRLYDFEKNAGNSPQGELLEASDGKLYGTTKKGGQNDLGVLYCFDLSTNTYSVKYHFDGTNGSAPNGGLVEDENGVLFGMTNRGGASGLGAIYSYDLTNNEFELRNSFSSSNGRYPYGKLLKVDTAFYGLTSGGGSFSKGCLFLFDSEINTITRKQSFYTTYGEEPWGSLVKAGNGKLYGTTKKGGSNGEGTVFEYTTSSNSLSPRFHFNSSNGKNPTDDLVYYSGSLLLGTTSTGGDNGYGVLFEFSTSTGNATVRYHFKYSDDTGAGPQGTMTKGSDGRFYGITYLGGVAGSGVLFSFSAASRYYSAILSMEESYGQNPRGTLVQASNGNLYGLAYEGGEKGFGVLFEYDIEEKKYNIKKHLDFDLAAYPNGSLLEASNGKLYGLTFQGSTDRRGTLFEYDPATNSFSIKKKMSSSTGHYPTGSLSEVSGSRLVGTTTSGGNNGKGIVFEYNFSTNAFSTVHHFNDSDGASPYSELVMASNGTMYGITRLGGVNNFGVIYSYDTTSKTVSKVYDLTEMDGKYATGALIEGSDQNLYGLANSGGSSDKGSLFTYNYTTNTFDNLYSFQTEGINPKGALKEIQPGVFYGLTNRGGSFDKGVLFSYDKSFDDFSVKLDFGGDNGALPLYSSLSEIESGIILAFDKEESGTFSVYPNPTNDFVFVKGKGQFMGIKVYNVHGELLKETKGNKIDMMNLPSGIYFVQLQNEVSESIKIIKE